MDCVRSERRKDFILLVQICKNNDNVLPVYVVKDAFQQISTLNCTTFLLPSISVPHDQFCDIIINSKLFDDWFYKGVEQFFKLMTLRNRLAKKSRNWSCGTLTPLRMATKMEYISKSIFVEMHLYTTYNKQ